MPPKNILPSFNTFVTIFLSIIGLVVTIIGFIWLDVERDIDRLDQRIVALEKKDDQVLMVILNAMVQRTSGSLNRPTDTPLPQSPLPSQSSPLPPQ